jgi:glycine oxidase
VKTWDAIIVGGGIIGLSLSLSLRKRGLSVLVMERGEPGREASHAAAGMLCDSRIDTAPELHELARASAGMYPEFVHQLQDESAINIDLREQGTLIFPGEQDYPRWADDCDTMPGALAEIEPGLANSTRQAVYRKERSVDPRALGAAVLQAAKHRGVDIFSGTAALDVLLENRRAAGVRSDKSTYRAAAVVNCAGAWAGLLPPLKLPTKPMKGQMLSVVAKQRESVRHVLRFPDVYIVPRSDGRVLIGATVEDAGFDKRTDPQTIHRLHQAALRELPVLAEARILEDWAGLRPGTADSLPILGAMEVPGYFVATGHFRDGILLSPVTAHVMAQVVTGERPDYDLSALAPSRFISGRIQ